MGDYKVVTLCGSTKFKDAFIEAQKILTLQGNIVISVGLFGHSGDIFSDEEKIMLDDMNKRKIDMADEIFVINVGDYIGESTESEIQYALLHGKSVVYLEQHESPIKIGTFVRIKDFARIKEDNSITSITKITTFDEDTYGYGKYAYTMENGQYLYEFEFEAID